MKQTVSITSQGQLTIPKVIRDDFGIHGPIKAIVRKKGNTIVVEPKKGFWSLSGSLKSEVSLTGKELKNARNAFSLNWPRNK